MSSFLSQVFNDATSCGIIFAKCLTACVDSMSWKHVLTACLDRMCWQLMRLSSLLYLCLAHYHLFVSLAFILFNHLSSFVIFLSLSLIYDSGGLLKKKWLHDWRYKSYCNSRFPYKKSWLLDVSRCIFLLCRYYPLYVIPWFLGFLDVVYVSVCWFASSRCKTPPCSGYPIHSQSVIMQISQYLTWSLASKNALFDSFLFSVAYWSTLLRFVYIP